MITLTQQAVKQLQELLGPDAGEERGLRLFVERGGCAGMNYAMKIDSPSPGDIVVEKDGVHLFIASDSSELLKDCEVDYTDDLSDAGFKIRNPNAARSCGCGTSFEPAGESPDAHGD